MAPSPSAPETEMLLDVMFGRVILVTFAPCHAGRGRGRGGAQFRAIITGQRLAEFNKTTISWSGGIFDRENTKHLSQIAVVFICPGVEIVMLVLDISLRLLATAQQCSEL